MFHCSQYRRNYFDNSEDLDSKYKRIRILGEGTYGVVYEALHLPTGRRIALKKTRLENTETPINHPGILTTFIRETVLLRELKHPNVIELFDVCRVGTQLWLSFELCDVDLRQYLKQKSNEMKKTPLERRDRTKPFLPFDQSRSLARQLLDGVAYCHSRRIIHRDLKPQNILLDHSGTKLKIGDFGLARTFTTPTQKNTHEVVTLWYRAPELLLGDNHYTPALDLWSIGCIIAEFVSGRPLFHGDSEIDTLFKIFRILGTPIEMKIEDEKCSQKTPNKTEMPIWPGVSNLQYYQSAFPLWRRNVNQSLKEAIPCADALFIDFLKCFFELNPNKRLSARDLLKHEWLYI